MRLGVGGGEREKAALFGRAGSGSRVCRCSEFSAGYPPRRVRVGLARAEPLSLFLGSSGSVGERCLRQALSALVWLGGLLRALPFPAPPPLTVVRPPIAPLEEKGSEETSFGPGRSFSIPARRTLVGSRSFLGGAASSSVRDPRVSVRLSRPLPPPARAGGEVRLPAALGLGAEGGPGSDRPRSRLTSLADLGPLERVGVVPCCLSCGVSPAPVPRGPACPPSRVRELSFATRLRRVGRWEPPPCVVFPSFSLLLRGPFALPP